MASQAEKNCGCVACTWLRMRKSQHVDKHSDRKALLAAYKKVSNEVWCLVKDKFED
jgi:hypothetical protein